MSRNRLTKRLIMVYNRAMAYIRTNIYITPKQDEGLTKIAAAKDIKFAEAVRQALAEYIAKHGGKNA